MGEPTDQAVVLAVVKAAPRGATVREITEALGWRRTPRRGPLSRVDDHAGQRSGSGLTGSGGPTIRSAIDYDAITERQCRGFARSWAPRTRKWAALFADHTSWRWWERAWIAVGWYVFGPVLWVKSNPAPRLNGDGPTMSCEFVMVARPRTMPPDRMSRPGHYLVTTGERVALGEGDGKVVIGVKDRAGLAELVLDYTRPGDLVVDPFAGTGTLGAVAVGLGRRYEGAEERPHVADFAQARLAAAVAEAAQVPMFAHPDRFASKEWHRAQARRHEQADAFPKEPHADEP